MIKVINNLQISKHFYLSEFLCHDGSNEITLDYKLVELLQKLRYAVGRPVRIVSGYRTLSWNEKVGGSPMSQHLEGKAADIKVKGYTPKELAELAEQLGFDGIGIYRDWLHVDCRGYKARW